MMELTQKFLDTKNKVNITKILRRTIGVEKASGSHDGTICRQRIKEKLEGEKEIEESAYDIYR